MKYPVTSTTKWHALFLTVNVRSPSVTGLASTCRVGTMTPFAMFIGVFSLAKLMMLARGRGVPAGKALKLPCPVASAATMFTDRARATFVPATWSGMPQPLGLPPIEE
jgi:hypothetical protein